MHVWVSPGTMGLKGDLTAGEIVEQLLHAQRVTRIKNIVFMVILLISCALSGSIGTEHLKHSPLLERCSTRY